MTDQNASMITPELVRLDVSLGSDKTEVIRALARIVAEAGRTTNPDGLAEDALAREATSATGLPGGGAAVGHGETPAARPARRREVAEQVAEQAGVAGPTVLTTVVGGGVACQAPSAVTSTAPEPPSVASTAPTPRATSTPAAAAAAAGSASMASASPPVSEASSSPLGFIRSGACRSRPARERAQRCARGVDRDPGLAVGEGDDQLGVPRVRRARRQRPGQHHPRGLAGTLGDGGREPVQVGGADERRAC